jgi:RNA recognition motif-containing protein
MRSQFLRGNVFVGNLPPGFSDERLAEAFDPFGIVLSASIARDPTNGKALRYGFVDIATERAAQHAVASMNGVAIDGHTLDVRISEHKPGQKRPPRAGPPLRRAAMRPRQPLREPQAPGEEAEHAPRPARRAASFVVERRPLPRRF